MNYQKLDRKIVWTPWGTAERQTILAPGIISVSTASHGGYWLSPERWLHLQSSFRVDSWAGAPWLEEDCDCNLAACRWPSEFEPGLVYHAYRAVVQGATQYPNFERCKAWLENSGSSDAALARRMHDHFNIENGGLWFKSGLASCQEGWRCWFRRVGDGASRSVILADYPLQPFYSESELDSLDLLKTAVSQ